MIDTLENIKSTAACSYHHCRSSRVLIKGDLFSDNEQTVQKSDYDKVILFPSDRYPETAKHIKDAIKEGHSSICTIDRDGVHKRREQSLKHVPVKTGYDRDELDGGL